MSLLSLYSSSGVGPRGRCGSDVRPCSPSIKVTDTLRSFLDDIPRIAQREYEPSDSDVVRSRLRTVGVQEYKLTMEKYGQCPLPAPCLRC